MKIQYASDLHLEFHENASHIKHNPLHVMGDVLVLAGDILYLGDDYTRHPFWDWCAQNYRHVIVCLGNHEFYKFYDLASLNGQAQIEIRPNVYAYYNKVVSIDGIDFIVSTMWSRIELKDAYYTEHYLSDFRRILYGENIMTFAEFNLEHDRCLSFIKESVLRSSASRKIVVTHHVPSFLMQDPRFANSKANGGFTIELADYIKDSGIDYWIYGHSHYNIDVNIGDTMCVSNQLGYVFNGEGVGFNPGKIIDL